MSLVGFKVNGNKCEMFDRNTKEKRNTRDEHNGILASTRVKVECEWVN